MTPQRQPGEWALGDEIHRGWLFFSSPDALLARLLLHGDEIHRADSQVLYWFPILLMAYKTGMITVLEVRSP